MSKRRIVFLALFIFGASSALAAAEVRLTALTLQPGKTFDLSLGKTSRAPLGAAMKATIGYDNGQASIKLSYQKMEPAVLFAGDIAAYVLWAVAPDGAVENLGEVIADRKSASGSLQAYTGRKTFALMVTAEPFAAVTRPTDLVVFISGQLQGMNITNTPFAFKDFATEYKPALDSISGIQYNDPTPAAVKQAQKAMEIAAKLNAAAVNPKAMDGAQIAFGKAMAATGDKKVMADQARVAVQLASQAIKDTVKVNEAKAAAEAEAKRQAERTALEARATTAEGESTRIAQQLRDVLTQREALASESAGLAKQTATLTTERDALKAERDRLAAERETIKKERDELAGLLTGRPVLGRRDDRDGPRRHRQPVRDPLRRRQGHAQAGLAAHGGQAGRHPHGLPRHEPEHRGLHRFHRLRRPQHAAVDGPGPGGLRVPDGPGHLEQRA
ncbi:MAG: hypothetical protein M0C28_33130 [Candidatus Moduliflexus flocculans]|nr:hypothetical protein [Candidatus Moduliflexus flocculans]